MNRPKRLILFMLVLTLAASVHPLPVWASRLQYCMNVRLVVDGEEVCSIPAFDVDYENNMYVSLSVLSFALNGTQKAFTPVVEKQKITITTDRTGAGTIPEPYTWTDETLPLGEYVTISKNKLLLDESERKYHSVIFPHGNGYDAFLPPISLAMMFDMDMKVTDDAIEIRTAEPFTVRADELEHSGYMQGVNAMLTGDGTTGEIYYQYDADTAFPIASTTKLMTYFVFMDAVSQGECSMDDTAVISDRVSLLSNGPDGVIPMREGIHVSVRELLHGMLIPSSNECALAIAEHTAGSESEFVQRMNAKAEELGLKNTLFYNCHGLPVYEDQLLPAKMHNHMTAEEMFVMASALVNTYPQVMEITSQKEYHLDAFNKDIKNSNAILYNVDGAAGLKTGTTNKAGSCLVTCIPTAKDGEAHQLITVLFGAEGDANRGIGSEILARYAMESLESGRTGYTRVPAGEEEREDGIPEDPERVIKKLFAVFPNLSFG